MFFLEIRLKLKFFDNVKQLTIFSVLTFLLFFASCDDGDVILSDFNFESDNVEFCFSENSNQTVFYNEGENQEVFYIIINEEYDVVEENESEYVVSPDATSSSQASVRSVKFAEIDPDDFFCNAVASTVVIENEVIGVGGTVSIVTQESIDPDGDTDSDGLTNEEENYDDTENENYDTDGDSIPNFRDEDDDNDRVMTQVEIGDGVLEEGETLEEDELPDTDEDGIPNYLDNDDDGDSILTQFEYSEGTAGPTDANVTNENNDGVLLYLDPNSNTIETKLAIDITNSHAETYNTIIRIDNLEADNVVYDAITSIGEFEETDVITQIIKIDENGNVIETIDADNEVPIAIISDIATTGTAPLTLTFNANTSLDPNGEGLSFLWDFDNGLNSSLAETSNTFVDPGVYNVILTVTDTNGNTDRDTIEITVN